MAQTAEILDVRPLSPAERLSTILGKWQRLPPGQTLRLVVEHDPMPLQFLLRGEAPGEFEWRYEKKGPDEWIVSITRIALAETSAKDDDRTALKNLLLRLHSGANVASVKEEAKDVLRKMDAQKLALLEQEIIQEGLGREEMRRLCDAHLEVMKESLESGQAVPEAGHPIHTLMEEHNVLKRGLEELRGYLEAMKGTQSFRQVTEQVEGIRRVAHLLLEAEKHHQREEEVIFPALERRGVTEPPAIMLQEHVDLRAKKALLSEMAHQLEPQAYREWFRGLEEVGEYLVEELGNHIYKEDNILYQIALQTIEPGSWADIKERCDRIGYCFFTPQVQAPTSPQTPPHLR